MKFWLGVVSKDHVTRGIQGGFAQVCHGKKGPLAKMKKGDWLVYYSPSEKVGEKSNLKAFTAIGQIADDEVFQFEMTKDFCPFRRKVNFKKSKDLALVDIKEKLSFTQRPNWGYQLRLGLIELEEADFKKIAQAMKA